MTTTALLTWRLPYAQEERAAKILVYRILVSSSYTILHCMITPHFNTKQCLTKPYRILLFPTLLYPTKHYTILYTARHYTTLHYNILHYTLHFTAPHFTAPHYTALHYTTLLCSVALHLNTKQYLPYRNLHYPSIPYRTPPTLHTTLHYILHYTSIFHS